MGGWESSGGSERLVCMRTKGDERNWRMMCLANEKDIKGIKRVRFERWGLYMDEGNMMRK